MGSDAVVVERNGAVAVVHLDDGKANALSAPVIAALMGAFEQLEADDSVGAVVLHGRPGVFCAGFDLGVMRGGDSAAIVDLVASGGELVRRVYGSRLPVVAACTGHALAAGALLLLGCDERVGTDAPCRIGLNEVAIGLVLPDWALTIAAARLSPRRLQTAVATAKVGDGAAAVESGFLDQVVSDDEVLSEATRRAGDLAGLHTGAYAGTVRALRGATLDLMATQIAADRRSGSTPVA